MSYKSDAQRKYFNANRDELESQGVNVDEWNESSKGMKLPKRAPARSHVSSHERWNRGEISHGEYLGRRRARGKLK